MAEFTYDNAKNAGIGHTLFKLNCDYLTRVFFEEDVDPRSKSRSANKLAKELRELMEVCYQNLLHAQELQKRVHNKGVKSQNIMIRSLFLAHHIYEMVCSFCQLGVKNIEFCIVRLH